MPTIIYPNVPMVSGVPVINRTTVAPAVTPVLTILSSALWQAIDTNPQWGIYDSNGKPLTDTGLSGASGVVLSAMGLQPILSTVGVDYSKEVRISDFPIEQGSFASYNKVELPAEPLVTMSYDGSIEKRTAFLNALDTATKSTGLYSVVTPEVKYINYSISRYSYSRYANKGLTLIIVNIWLKEIRQVTPQFASTKNAKSDNAKSAQNNGIVQTKTVSGGF